VPYITLQVTAQGLACDIFIGVSEARRAALTAAGRSVPGPQILRALIDTGASCTCVDPIKIKPLGLTPTGAALPMNTASTDTTPVDADQYDVSLVIPPLVPQDPPLIRQTIPVAEMPLFAAIGVHALIGRDVLAGCLLIYDGKNEFFQLAY